MRSVLLGTDQGFLTDAEQKKDTETRSSSSASADPRVLVLGAGMEGVATASGRTDEGVLWAE